MSRVGLHFNGTNAYCKIPVSVTSAQSWEVTLSISTDSNNKYGNAIYNQPCIWGYDSRGYASKDFHIDLKNGNLYIFAGLGGTNTASQLNYGTLTKANNDCGWDTGIFIADSALHTIRAVYADNKITIYLDGTNLGYFNTAYTIYSSDLYLGCSKVGESKYAVYNLYDFNLKIDGVDSVIYAPDDADIALNKLTDMSGNSNDGTLYGTVSSVGYMMSMMLDMERVIDTAFLTVIVDTMRMTHVPALKWRYDNIGTIADLINTSNAVQLSNLPITQSKTGFAFYQDELFDKIFDVADSGEYWIRFDVYNSTNDDVFVGDYTTINPDMEDPQSVGVSLTYGDTIILWYNGDSANIDYTPSSRLESYLIHMKSGISDGFVEIYSSVAGLLGEHTGNVNNGYDFEHLTATGSSSNFLSNIVISNQPLWLDDDATLDISVDYYADLLRKVENAILFAADTERIVVGGTSINYAVDTERVTYYGVSINYLADTEREISIAVSYYTDTERIVSDGELTTLYFDTMRMTTKPSTAWRYETIGKISDLQNAPSAVQLSNLPRTQSIFGVAFYVGLYDANVFKGTQSSREVWIRFDAYRIANYSWRMGARYASNDNEANAGVRVDSIYPNKNRLWVDTVSNAVAYLADDTAKVAELQSFLLHMIGDFDGLMEVYTDDGGLIYEFHGEVNDAEIFDEFNAFGSSGAYFSNVIISNQPIWLDDHAVMSEPVSLSFDVDRQVCNTVDIIADAERLLLTWTENISLSLDTNRDVVLVPTLSIDAERDLYSELSISIDTERFIIGAEYALAIDAVRQIGNGIVILYDKERYVNNTVVVPFDTEREIIRIENFHLDTTRYLPYQLTIDGTETTVIPMAPNDAGLQSINIQMSEQQVTDRVSFVHAGNCNIMDKIQGTYRDYVFDLRIEETDRQGILQTCSCCSDIDEILYSQIAYTIPEDKYEWSEDYLEWAGIKRQEHPDEDIELQPTTTAEEHLRMIANKMGKNLVYRGVKFYSTNNVDENGGKTYASVISELIGWSSRLPHMEINAYFRGDTLYVVQRGFESNTVSLSGAKIANLKINQKLMRTTWGSDIKSESTVDTFINEWAEIEKEPYNPSSGGSSTYNDDNLVETTTTESETERTETTYYYEIGEHGEKYLAYERTVKYEIDERGNWQEYDTITTTHERVSTTQSHIYAEDSDGAIVGEVVSPNRFDDRATPYDMGRYTSDFNIVHDSQGNQYKLLSIKHFSEKLEKGTRTTYGLSLVDTSFPVYGEANLTYLTQQLMLLNRKVEETISMDVYDIDHVIGFDDKISFNGATYYLKSNNVLQDERTVNKQSLVMVRWF